MTFNKAQQMDSVRCRTINKSTMPFVPEDDGCLPSITQLLGLNSPGTYRRYTSAGYGLEQPAKTTYRAIRNGYCQSYVVAVWYTCSVNLYV